MEALDQIEFDVIEISDGCAEACVHCSESPVAGVRHGDVDRLLRAIETIRRIGRKKEIDPFGNYWLPFPASDPFAHPHLFRLCNAIWNTCNLPAYLLSLGWNRTTGSSTASQFAESPESLFRIAITISNFSRVAERNRHRHCQRLAETLLDLKPLWPAKGPDGKPLVILSPQFVSDIPTGSPFSLDNTRGLLSDVAQKSGIDLERWRGENRIFERPVIGLGRALTTLGVRNREEITVTAEIPFPEVSKHPLRPWSGLITLDGHAAVYRGRRGLLGRDRDSWLPFDWDKLLSPH